MLIKEPLLGLSAFPQACHLIMHSRPLLVLTLLGGALPLACGLFMAAFFWLVVEPWPQGSGPLLNVLGYLCLVLSLVAFPVWGPLSFVVQRRAFLLTFVELAGPAATREREHWFELGMAWLTGLVARLCLAFVATALVLLLFSATTPVLRLLGVETSAGSVRTLQTFVGLAFAIALTYLVPQHRRHRGAARATLLTVWRHMPRFVGYQGGLVLLAMLVPFNLFLPALAAVAGALFHIDSAESEP